MRKVIAILPFLALAACGNPDTPGGRAADARHESFESLGKAMKAIDGGLKASTPDLAAIRQGAATLNELAPKLATWFPAGSGPQDGMKTHAKADAWTKPEEFKAAADKFVTEAGKFNTLAQAGDVAAIGAGMKDLGGSCKGCHDKFKEED